MESSRATLLLDAALRSGGMGEGAPLVILVDLDDLDRQFNALREAFPASTLHAVAVKACPVMSILRRLVERGAGLEVASRGELALALRMAPGAKIVFDSPAKTPDELRYALESQIRINADNFQELERLVPLTPAKGVGIRLNPVLSPGVVAMTSTAVPGSQFGVDLSRDRAAVLSWCRRYPWIDGLHVHVGSQGGSVALLVQGAAALVELAREANAGGGNIRSLDIGGGLSVDYRTGAAPAFTDLVEQLHARTPELFSGAWELITEFGRRLLATCGIAASRVEYTKESSGTRIAITHAGSDLFLRMVYRPEDWQHRLTVHSPDGLPKHGPVEAWDVAGPLCFSGDLLARAAQLPHIEPGDIIVVHDAGAYTLALWSRYVSRCSPGVLGWSDTDGLRCLRRPETVQDVLRFWE